MLLDRLIFDEFAPFGYPCDIELGPTGNVRPPFLSDVMLDVEFFRCKDPDLEARFTANEEGFVDHATLFDE